MVVCGWPMWICSLVEKITELVSDFQLLRLTPGTNPAGLGEVGQELPKATKACGTLTEERVYRRNRQRV